MDSLFLIAYAVAILLIPDQGRRNDWFEWLPHMLARKLNTLRIVGLQVWLIFFLGITVLSIFLEPGRGANAQLFSGTILTALLIHCLWMRRPVVRRADLEADLIELMDQGAAIFYADERSMLELEGSSSLLREDLAAIGIDGVRIGLTRHLPGRLPEGVSATPLPDEVADAITELFRHLNATCRQQAEEIMASPVQEQAQRIFELETNASQQQERIDKLSTALQRARDASASPMQRGFSSREKEIEATIDHLLSIAPKSILPALKQLHEQWLLNPTTH